MASCKFCGKDITWLREGRKNTPLDGDGAVHRCEQMKKTLSSVRSIDPKTLSPEVIKKYEESINRKAKEADAKKKARRY